MLPVDILILRGPRKAKKKREREKIKNPPGTLWVKHRGDEILFAWLLAWKIKVRPATFNRMFLKLFMERCCLPPEFFFYFASYDATMAMEFIGIFSLNCV